MPRKRQLPKTGFRRTITFNLELDEKLIILAAQRRIPLSLLVEELVLRAMQPPPTPESLAVDFPPDWEGADLRERLYYLRMRQSDLAEALDVPTATVNNWIREKNPYPADKLPAIQKALKKHKPGSIQDFKAGSRSPKF